MMELKFFAMAARGTEQVLKGELDGLLGQPTVAGRGGVAFSGPLRLGYQACLWSQVASRILLTIGEFSAEDDAAFYRQMRALPWADHLGVDQSFAVQAAFGGAATEGLNSPRFVALRTKDAIVDELRAAKGRRPDVDRRDPDLRFFVYRAGPQTTVSIDLSGQALFRRGQGRVMTSAPLKENLAAAILRIAGWPERYDALVDPMCGSATLAIEAARAAYRRAPGLARASHGFQRWSGHDPTLWRELVSEAKQIASATAQGPPIYAFDASAEAVAAAKTNLQRAQLAEQVIVAQRDLLECAAPLAAERGMVVVNPPYGVRLGDEAELATLYEALGNVLRRRFCGWHAWVFTGSRELAKRIGLRASSRHELYNGKLPCRLLELPIADRAPDAEIAAWQRPHAEAEMYRNRLRKNVARLRRWARAQQVDCYRLYDADVPQYNVAVDWYDGLVVVAEYARPLGVDAGLAVRRMRDVVTITSEILEIPESKLVVRVRRRQREGAQYEKRDDRGELHWVREGGLRFAINTTDYLDTGLFLDHRLVRRYIREHAAGKRLLNLFAYTCSASVAAAHGGAIRTTSVDLSRRYLAWGEQNFAENQLSDPQKHRFVRQDIRQFLERDRQQYDLIFVAPPAYSRSKGLDRDFDLRRDHIELLQHSLKRLAPGGELIFSTPLDFELDLATLGDVRVVEVTRKMTPLDFAQSKAPPRTFLISQQARS
ncbi:MAG: bifunctional 23S rRNA (guanine(2069)-N(7))-methyltransferase RlmK/23S rRNA (guanine(2445)-N(2))-methyltransferase RlmL [Deltaproteobacteria bacterium]|nr:bifunctional 23S rRNA (guanine(2069)-N(7))-methyltransferase RlmK/23S rRNA (guanine(2445)-N(2))-methyltransferase RlmL [Deltaproteobacteria bacterium]